MAIIHSIDNIPSLNHLLDLRCQEIGDKTLYTFIGKDLSPIKELTYSQFRQSALKIASHLRKYTQPGDRAVLLFPPSLDYVEAYFGCLYAGVIAVPVFPPQMGRQIGRVMQIVQDSKPSAFMSTGVVFDQVKMIAPQWVKAAGDNWLSTDRLDEIDLDPPHEAGRQDVAFLQYTSGSTGNPKGVVISHENLLVNEEMIRRGFGTDEHTQGVNWLPLYHDMGLIGTVLHPIYLGGSSVLMSPFTFLTGPQHWLKAISKYKGTCCGGPNFAFEMCVNKISEEVIDELDLSSWKQAFNGAEPIRAKTLKRFEEKFARAGFNPESWRACYGLAEATLMVSTATSYSPKKEIRVDSESLKGAQVSISHSEEGTSLVSSGIPVDGQEIKIVNLDTKEAQGELGIGEIWLQGKHIARGYWEKPEVNATEFNAYLPNGKDGPYFRTGDLGFLYEGELYITGRQKDLIIIRGKNHYPQDIEQTAMEAHPAIQAGGIAAFGVEDEKGEGLVLVSELVRNGLKKYKGEEITEAIRKEVSAIHELQPQAIVLIPRKGLSKTSSGKIQRRANKKAYLDGKLEVSFLWEGTQEDVPENLTAQVEETNSPKDLKEWLMQWMVSKLDMSVDKIDMDDPITAYGVDSLMLAEFETEVSEFMGKSWPVRDLLLTEPSLEELIEKGEEWMAEGVS
ncbi:MAG: AMP-binding protein [Bacteroidia bacterium]|nr:AMP-binding protein [Bacteroidia bacterium]